MKLVKIFFMAFCLTLVVLTVGKTESQATTHTIKFSGMSFTPDALDVSVGDTIVWSGNFGFHEIQSLQIPSGASTFGPSQSTDVTLVYVVTVPGQYNYQCNIHFDMGMVGEFTAVKAGVRKVENNNIASLEENFPNPFSGVTKIKYNLNKPSAITLKLFDINGKELRTLESKYQNAGSYEYQFDGSNLANGTYIYQLQAGEVVLVNQMIVLKK